jgi:hypothetical protein
MELRFSGGTPMRLRSLIFWTGVWLFAAITADNQSLSQDKTPPSPAVKSQSKAEAKQPDYSKEPVIIERFVMRTAFENDGTWSREMESAVKMQSEAGVQQYGLLMFGYSSTNDKIEIGYVRVRKPDGTVIVTPPENIQDTASEVTRTAPMYSDYREKHVAVKALGIGDTLEYQVHSQEVKPLVPGQFWMDYDFTRNMIVLDEQLEISVPKSRDLNLKSPEVKPVVTESGERRVYSWKTSNLERLSEEKQKEKDRKEKDGPPASIQLTTFKSWDELARWWGALKDEQVQPTPEIRAKAAELTRDAKSEEDKLRSIYNYVAVNFRYISLSFGSGVTSRTPPPRCSGTNTVTARTNMACSSLC